jgi:hypothetical protein
VSRFFTQPIGISFRLIPTYTNHREVGVVPFSVMPVFRFGNRVSLTPQPAFFSPELFLVVTSATNEFFKFFIGYRILIGYVSYRTRTLLSVMNVSEMAKEVLIWKSKKAK